MAKKNIEKEGICALTKKKGVYAKSHLIPRALTFISKKGEMRKEMGLTTPPKKRFDSWYDKELCIQEGESILEKIDDDGIKELRKHKLIWSGWPTIGEPLSDLMRDERAPCYGIRCVQITKPKKLQLFFLSLLWRAAATHIKEFDTVQLSESEIEDLRCRVNNKDVGNMEDYPIRLFQLITKDTEVVHNRTPIRETESIKLPNGEFEFDYVRFYFDGLIAHIYLKFPKECLQWCLGFGNDGYVLVEGHNYDGSREFSDLMQVVQSQSN